MMDYVVQIIDSIAWPIIVVWLGYLFRSEIKSLVSRINRLKYRDFEAHFDAELQRLEFESLTLKQFEPRVATVEKDVFLRLTDPYRQIAMLAEQSPRTAIALAWVEVEKELNELYDKAGFGPSDRSAIYKMNLLVHQEILPDNAMKLITGLHNLRNESQHFPDFVFDEKARRYLSVASGIVNMLHMIEP